MIDLISLSVPFTGLLPGLSLGLDDAAGFMSLREIKSLPALRNYFLEPKMMKKKMPLQGFGFDYVCNVVNLAI